MRYFRAKMPQFTGCWGKKSDLEPFAQALLHQCSLFRASAYSSGPKLLTLQGIYYQDHMLTTGMGGVLPEQPDPTIFDDVLDMGCGTGGWITEVAKAYPGVACIGIDISKRMIEYAKTQVNEQQIHEQLAFLIMDALKPLAFADKSFDLINMRLGVSFMRTWDWSNLLNELRRIIRPNAIIRIVSGEIMHRSNTSTLK